MDDRPISDTPLATSVGDELAARIASDYLNSRKFRLRRVTGRGLVNHIFVAELGNRQIVIRLCDDAWAHKQHQKEAWCLRRVGHLGISGPEVFALGVVDRTSYMVESYVEGTAGDELPPHERLRVWRELGRYARVIHRVSLNGFGVDLPDFTSGDARGGWQGYVDYNIESLEGDDALLELDVLTREQSSLVQEIFRGLRNREYSFGLNHGDLSLNNTIIDRAGRVVLLDWGTAAADIVPHLDFVQLLKKQLHHSDPDKEAMSAFLDGYGMQARDYDAMLPELKSILLLRSFDLVRYAIDREPSLIPFYAGQARRALAINLNA